VIFAVSLKIVMVRFQIFGLIGAGIALTANMLAHEMIDQINQKLPKEKQISWFWYLTEIKRQHKTMYPNSKLSLLLNICSVGLVVWFLVIIWFWVLGR
jgi:hypothetical protein